MFEQTCPIDRDGRAEALAGPPAVVFRGVTKSFPKHSTRAFLLSHLFSFARHKRAETFTALDEVSFALERGRSLAVVGANGAGKSTLLTLVAGISKPDAGIVTVNGRVAALLELGSGFHPDLTGAENLVLNAALLGLTRRRVRELFEEIVEFSELGDFIQEPLRTYSTGMVMRLAFSVAVNVDPEILIIDEVLAVGDQHFQAKCLRKVREFKEAGKTLICVSHATGVVESLCDSALWLDHGRVVRFGGAPEILRAYRESA